MKKQKAIFLDRDGVINNDEGHYYVHKIMDFLLTPQLGSALQLLHNAGYLLFVITNQGGVAKGKYTLREVEALHKHLQNRLAYYGVSITEMYCCPHHPDYGQCLCRKPRPLMVQKAVARFHINTSLSYFIGDRDTDIATAQAAGIKGILVPANQGIMSAVQQILSSEKINQ